MPGPPNEGGSGSKDTRGERHRERGREGECVGPELSVYTDCGDREDDQ